MALEKKVAKAEDNFAAMIKTLEVSEDSMRARKAQQREVIEKLRFLEEKIMAKVRELRLVFAELRQHLDKQE